MKKFNMFLYGEPYTGKTTLANTFPNAFIISTDGNAPTGSNNIVISSGEIKLANGMTKKATEWEMFIDIIEKALNSDKVETVVIDVMLDIFEMCRTYQLSKLGLSHESEMKFGVAYDKVRRPFTDLMRKISNSDKHIIFITHEDKNIIDGEVTPNISPKILERLTGYTQIFGRLVTKEDRQGNPVRELVAYKAPKQLGGNRFGINKPIIEPDYNKILEAIKGEK